MNTVQKVICERRSTKHFHYNHVPEKLILKILEAGVWAPSTSNVQPWHFTVVYSSKTQNKLRAAMRVIHLHYGSDDERTRAMENDYDPFYNAPVIIVVSGAPDDPYAPLDCAFAVENMALAAHSMGLGSCIVGMRHLAAPSEEDNFLAELAIPEGYQLQLGLCVGFAANDEQEKRTRDTTCFNFVR